MTTPAAIPPSECPACGYRLTVHDPLIPGRVPKPGSISVCLRCAAPLMFGPDLSLRLLREAEVRELSEHDREGLDHVQGMARRRGPLKSEQ